MLNVPSFLISSPSLKFTIFLYLSPIGHLDIADPSSMQDTCHHELSKYDLYMLATSLPVAQWLERPTGVRKVMGSIPVRDSDFFFGPRYDMLNIPSFLISSPSLKFTIFLYLSGFSFFASFFHFSPTI